MDVCVHVREGTHVEVRGQPQIVFLRSYPPLFSEMGFLTGLRLASLMSLLA